MRIGIDLGGTKIEVVALDDSDTERLRRRIDAPRGDYEATVRTLVELITETKRTLDCEATVGMGHPGWISPRTGLVKNSNSTWLNGRPLKRDLESRLGFPIRTTNDANCFALSETVDGAAKGAGIVFGVILGTGVGGGCVVDGSIVNGANGIAGEWGHNPLPWLDDDDLPKPACYCGRSGCIETYLSGPGLARDYEARSGRALSGAEIAASRDAHARASLDLYVIRLARSLATVVNLLDPDVIVLGGGVGRIERLYEDVPAIWSRWIFSDEIQTRLVAPIHGDASGVRGAARLWPLP